jgi:transcriptional regulator ATRX
MVKTPKAREKVVSDWNEKGGVLIMTYDMYSRLTGAEPPPKKDDGVPKRDHLTGETYEPFENMNNNRRRRNSQGNENLGGASRVREKKPDDEKQREEQSNFHKKMKKMLDETTELLIIDEGTRLKNHRSVFAYNINKMKTRNRIILTGTPLQNHLGEYYNMVNFVRKNYWTREDFNTLFMLPIEQGSTRDAGREAVEQMKKQSYILVHELKKFVNRQDQQILLDSLPPKREFVISFKIGAVQRQLYNNFLSSKVLGSLKRNVLFWAAMLQKIINHPDMLYIYCKRAGIATEEEQRNWEQSLRRREALEDEASDDEENFQPPIKKQRLNNVKQEFISVDDDDDEIFSPPRMPIMPRPPSLNMQEPITIDDDDDIEPMKPMIKPEQQVRPSPRQSSVKAEPRTSPVRTPIRRSSPSATPPQRVKAERAPQPEEEDEIDQLINNPPTPKEISRSRNKKRKLPQQKKKQKKKASVEDNFIDEEEQEQAELEEIFNGEDEVDGDDDFAWAKPVLQPQYRKSRAWHSPKMEFLLRLIGKCYETGEKMLIFSQYTEMLDVMENIFKHNPITMENGEKRVLEDEIDYLRLQGSNSTKDRQRMIDEFNNEDTEVKLFLISTMAGGQGINLTAATRVVIFDVTYDPTWSSQAIFRAYRFGQKKPVHVYRFVTCGTVEEKIWKRCVGKMWMARRIVDDKTPERKLNLDDLRLFVSDGRIDEDPSEPLLNPAVYENDDFLKDLVGTNSRYDATVIASDVMNPVHVLERDFSQPSPSSSNSMKQEIKIDDDDEDLSFTEEIINRPIAPPPVQRRMDEDEEEILPYRPGADDMYIQDQIEAEFNARTKIKSIFHFESLYIEDRNDRISEAEGKIGLEEYNTQREQMRRLREASGQNEQDSDEEGMPQMPIPMPMPQPRRRRAQVPPMQVPPPIQPNYAPVDPRLAQILPPSILQMFGRLNQAARDAILRNWSWNNVNN